MRCLLVCSLAAALLAGPSLAVAQQAKQEREAVTPQAQLNEVGKGRTLARQALKPGAFITQRHRKAVQAWLARNQGPGKPCLPGLVRQGNACAAPAGAVGWQMGSPVAAAAKLETPPPGLLTALPPAPPGNRYVLLSGDILLIAAASRIVVDAVPANK